MKHVFYNSRKDTLFIILLLILSLESCNIHKTQITLEEAQKISDSIHQDSKLEKVIPTKNSYVFYYNSPESNKSFIYYYRVQEIKKSGKVKKVSYKHQYPIALEHESEMWNY